MSTQNAPNRPPAAGTDAPEPPQGIAAIGQKIFRSIAIILVLQTVFKYAGDYIKAPVKEDFAKPDIVKHSDTDRANKVVDASQTRDYSLFPRAISPLWTAPTTLDMDIYLSEEQYFKPSGNEKPFISEKDISLGSWSDTRKVHKSIRFSDAVLKNHSLYAHVFTYKTPGSAVRSGDPDLGTTTLKSTHLLTRYMPRRRDTAVKKLIGGSSEELATEEKPKEDIVAYYHTNFTLSVVGDGGKMPWESVHPTIRPFITLDPNNNRDETGVDGYYLPIVYENSFWLLRDHMYPINETVREVPFHFELNQVGMMKMQVFNSLDQAVKQQSMTMGGSGAEFEEVKRIFLETNVWLLGITFLVSCLHSLFELLAFKNDIVHFRSRKDNTGVSVNSILMNVFMQTVVLLYLLDNQENASYVILLGQGFGIAVEAWKITKSVNVRLVPVDSFIPYRIKFEDKHVLNETEKQTKEYDADATKYLLYASVPLLIMYSIYSVVYEEHRSWWSFIITTLVGFVYFYGFLTMVPSLWINYKLKSVAHMSHRALTYKFLNTIVDDFFAFIIKQPVLARIAAFRDDVVFVIFIYQSFIYRVDKTRVNEFGQSEDTPPGAAIEAEKKEQ